MNKEVCSLSGHIFNMVLKILANIIKKEKETKRIWIEKEETELPLFTDDITIYVEIPKKLTHKTSWT